MAKKKSKNANLSLILKVVVLALGVAAFCMAFVASVKFSYTILGNTTEVSYSGFQSMFGYSETTTAFGAEVTTKYLGFSIMSTLAFVMPLVGAVLSLTGNKVARWVGAGLMIAGAVLIFFVPQFTILAKVDGELTAAATVLNGATRSLGIGAILGGVFAALGGLVAGYSVLKK